MDSIQMFKYFNDKDYIKMCSEKTLQTNNEGFFMNFADLVAEKAGNDWIKNVFGRLKTDRERIRIIYEYEKTKEPIVEILSNVQEIYRKKSAEVSQSRRLDAEKLYRTGQFTKALGYLSQSVIRAPKQGEIPNIDNGLSLAVALWNRALLLMRMNEFSQALHDFQLAMKEGLPDSHKADAFGKMGICYKAMKEDNRAKVSFGLAEKLLKTSEARGSLEIAKRRQYVQKKKEDRRITPSVAGEPHKVYKNASKKINVKQTTGLGRYVVASEQINTGDTLVVESPYVACLLPDFFGTHCHNCFERFLAPIGCEDCSSVAFCNAECRQKGMPYHKYECKFLDLLIGSGMSILAQTALRMVTQNSLEKCLEIANDRSKERSYSLCTNSTIRPASDFLQRTLMAAFLLRCLQKSGYFNSTADNVIPDETELQIGELLLFHLQMLQFNAHEIYETRHTLDHRFRDSKATYIGVAVYPTVSLFNHDCYPAVARYFVGKNIVIKAIRPIPAQGVIPENYGPIFTRRPLSDRQRSLSGRYWFNCCCEACTGNWPSLSNGLNNVSLRIKCGNKKCFYFFSLPVSKTELKCPKCQKDTSLTENIQKLKWCEEQYELGFKALDEQMPEKGIQILCPAIDTFHKISRPPHAATHLAQETLRACMADFGNTSPTLVKETITK